MAAFLSNLITASIHGSIVILAVLLLRLVLRRTPKKFICLLWLLAGIRLLMPFEICSELSLQPELPPVQLVQEAAAPERELPPMPMDVGPVLVPEEESIPRTEVPVVTQPVLDLDIYEGRQDADVTVTPGMSLEEQIPWIWLSVVCGFAVYTLVAYLRLRIRVRDAVKIPGGWESDRIETAFILGFIKPRIYIPMGMGEKTRRYILEHERTHLEKGDHWYKMLGFVALAIHWFNPLVWVAYICLCRDIEMACDERVVRFMEVGERKEYSTALLTCSSSRAHYGVCPVAFGEVSVKARILAVLNYRKPSFWISLVGVGAVAFVTVCLLTNPTQQPQPEPADPQPAEVTEPAAESAVETGYADTLSESEIIYTCQQALEDLKALPVYCISRTLSVESNSEHFGSSQSGSILRRHGDNFLTSAMEGTEETIGSVLYYEGRQASHMGDAWAWENGSILDGWDPDSWMDAFSPQGKMTSQPERVDENTVSFQAQWTEASPFDREYSGTFTFTFLPDGSLESVTRDYVYQVDPESGGGEVHYIHSFALQTEDPDLTEQCIRTAAESAVTMEELEVLRREAQMVTEVPSNKTSYDKDFLLGSGQMGWQMLEGEWFFKFSAENVSKTGLTIQVEYSGPYGNYSIGQAVVTAGETYFLEKLDNGVWVTVEPKTDVSIQVKTLAAGSTQSIDWRDTYGELPPGFYRLGNYYTAAAGEQRDTVVAYAKFRLYDPQMDALLNTCRQELQALLDRESYHLLVTSIRQGDTELSHATEEIWKNGDDYLLDGCSYYRETGEKAWGSGLMRRSGTDYSIHWVDSSSYNDVAHWQIVTYPTLDNYQIWSWDFILYDAKVSEVTRAGNTITVRELDSFDPDIPYVDTTFIFDEQGRLAVLTRALVHRDGSRDTINEMISLSDNEAQSHIEGQDLTAIPGFSWTVDLETYNAQDYAVRTMNFRNTQPCVITGAQEAIDRAMADCTLPAVMDLEPGTNMSQAFYDTEAGMWKVEFTASWDDAICQIVYMDSRGITQRTVTMEP